MKLYFTIILLLFSLSEISRSQPSRIDLNEGWQFRRVGDTVWYPAIVPGCVHTDLYNNHLIPDPFYGDNEKELQWIENEDWEYETNFFVNDSLLKQENIKIHFGGLDTYAEVFLNGKWIIEADNMNRNYEYAIYKELLRGNNKLKVLFQSPVKKAAGLKRLPELPGGNQVYTRKASYMFGWDWGPRFVTCGIWKKVFIESYSGPILGEYDFTIKALNKKEAKILFTATIKNCDNKSIYGIRLDDQLTNKCYFNNTGVNLIYSDYGMLINFGYNASITQEQIFQIDNPKLWWCNGYGEPFIYKMKLSFFTDGKLSEEKLINIALRTIELDQSSKLFGGENFQFKLNDKPVYIKGANYIPPNSFPSSISKKDYERLINDAVASNFNMLRVWGGGYYESEEFYDLCDEKGIMVWQDFMFACAMYPGNRSFVENVRAEAIEITSRLRKHPCIALWCGNNEIDEGWHNWGWQEQFKYSAKDSAKIWNDYLNLFEKVLPDIVKENSYGVPYISTSPKIGWGHPESMKEGDSHYWGVWWGNEPFEMYEKKVPRFMSEFGFQSFPDKKTIDQFAKPEDEYLGSPVMKAHQKHPVGYETIQTYMEREYKQPKDFESYVYVSQLLQAYGIKRAIEAERRSKPYCMGTLYWQFNDCWPVVSWSGIDYFGRWKALQYFVRDAYEDILVSPYVENGTMNVYVVSDRQGPVSGTLNLKLIDFDGNVLWHDENKVTLSANESKNCYQVNVDDLRSLGNPNQLCFVAEFTDEKSVVYSNKYYFVTPKELQLPEPGLVPEFTWDGKSTLYVSIKSTKLAKNVHIEVDSMDVKLSNNDFDISPGERIDILIHDVTDYEKLKRNIRIKTLRDSY